MNVYFTAEVLHFVLFFFLSMCFYVSVLTGPQCLLIKVD